MTNDQLLGLIKFVLWRFFGHKIADEHLMYAIKDYKKREGIK